MMRLGLTFSLVGNLLKLYFYVTKYLKKATTFAFHAFYLFPNIYLNINLQW